MKCCNGFKLREYCNSLFTLFSKLIKFQFFLWNYIEHTMLWIVLFFLLDWEKQQSKISNCFFNVKGSEFKLAFLRWYNRRTIVWFSNRMLLNEWVRLLIVLIQSLFAGSKFRFRWNWETCILQSKQVKRTPQDSINELIIWKMNPVVIPITSVKLNSKLLHA